MRNRTESRGTVMERMREQLLMKQLRGEARQRGVSVEVYLAQVETDRNRREETDRILRLSETLAHRIAERVKVAVGSLPVAAAGALPAAPSEPERIPFDDLQGIVDHLLDKKVNP
jgi:hypothetical protein